MKGIKDYIEELNTIDEHVRIEAKQCTDKIDKSVLESICSFSNEPGLGGGVILRELKQLEQSGLISMKGSGRNTYYIPSDRLNTLYTVNGGTSGPNGGTSVDVDDIPKSLKDRIDQMGLRVPKKVLTDIIIDLCRIRPFSGEELAAVLGRTETHIKNKIVPTLIEKGRLDFIYPEMINHPHQKYTAR